MTTVIIDWMSWIKDLPSEFWNAPSCSHFRVALTPFFLSEWPCPFLGYKGNIPRVSAPCWNWLELGNHTYIMKAQRATCGAEKGSDEPEESIPQCPIWIIWEHSFCHFALQQSYRVRSFFQKHLRNQELQIPLALDETWTLEHLNTSSVSTQSYKASCLILSIKVSGLAFRIAFPRDFCGFLRDTEVIKSAFVYWNQIVPSVIHIER